MTNYFETKSQPITMHMVLKAYENVRANKGSGGVDAMTWEELDSNLMPNLYKLWNRLSSGSYFPMPVKEVEIKKRDGGIRKLGIPTLLDRIAQQVVRSYLEPKLDPLFHNDSYAYRKGKSAHQAIETATNRIWTHDWVLKIDIRKFFDTLDHDLLIKALRHYCPDKWVLMYVERWLKAGVMTREGTYVESESGTPQGGVISPLLANLYLHVSFDAWMQKHHPEKPFERYADDIMVHLKTDKQSWYMLGQIKNRMKACKLTLHPEKTHIVNLRGITQDKYPRSVEFLGYTLKPVWSYIKASNRYKLLVMPIMSKSAQSRIFSELREMKLHKRRKPITELANDLRSYIQGKMNYYCKFNPKRTYRFWYQVNQKLLKWVKWQKGTSLLKSISWLREVWRHNPRLFPHWQLVHP